MVSRYSNLKCLRCHIAVPFQWPSFTLRCISSNSSDPFDSGNYKSKQPQNNTTRENKKSTHGREYLNRPNKLEYRQSITYALLAGKHMKYADKHEKKDTVKIKQQSFKKPYVSTSYEELVLDAARRVAASMNDQSVSKALLEEYSNTKKQKNQTINYQADIISIIPQMKTAHAPNLKQRQEPERRLRNEKEETIDTIVKNCCKLRNEDYVTVLKYVDEDTKKTVTLKTWKILEDAHHKQLITHYPSNGFEEMIQWTEEGKLWKFPIDNEQGMEEHNVHFSKHVFLERHLKNWCPTKGPIRHFMELICVGLSKNPYLTVEEKFNHIMWYKDYFAEKQKLLMDLGTLEKPITDSPNKIES